MGFKITEGMIDAGEAAAMLLDEARKRQTKEPES